MDEKPKITHSVNKEFQKAAGQYESNVPNKELVESSEKEETMENSVDAATSESLFSEIKGFLTSVVGAVIDIIKKLFESNKEPNQTIDGDNGTNNNDNISDNNNKVNKSKNSVNSEGDNAKIGDNNIDGDNNKFNNAKSSINMEMNESSGSRMSYNSTVALVAFVIGVVLIVALFTLSPIISAFSQSSSPTESVSENGGNDVTNFSGYNATEIHFHYEREKQNSDPSEKNTSPDEPSDSAIVTSVEPTEPTTTTPAATTTSRPVQTERPYTPPPPIDPQPPERTELPTPEPVDTTVVTPPETLPPETTFATTTTPGVGVENDFEYSLVNGQAIVTGYYGTETVVRIPDYLAGSPVSIIDKGAFADKTFISGIQFPCTLIKIEENAFAGCCNLMDVQIPASVTDIGAYAFVNSAGGELSFPNGTQMTVIVENAFYGSLMQKVHIPEGVIEIKESAFRDCSELVDIVLPVSLEYIGNYAFFNSNPIERKLQYCGTADKWAGLVKDKTIYNSATVPSCNYGKNPL